MVADCDISLSAGVAGSAPDSDTVCVSSSDCAGLFLTTVVSDSVPRSLIEALAGTLACCNARCFACPRSRRWVSLSAFTLSSAKLVSPFGVGVCGFVLLCALPSSFLGMWLEPHINGIGERLSWHQHQYPPA